MAVSVAEKSWSPVLYCCVTTTVPPNFAKFFWNSSASPTAYAWLWSTSRAAVLKCFVSLANFAHT